MNKLPLYQLAGALNCPQCKQNGMGKPWDWSLNNIMNTFNTLVGAAGSVNNLVNAFKQGKDIPGTGTLSAEEKAFLLQMGLKNQEAGGGAAGAQAMMTYLTQMQEQNAKFMEKFMERLDKNKGNNSSDKDNTPLYIGLGVGGFLLVMMMIVMMNKK